MEKILIVDDEAFIRENLERILAEDGYRPFSTDNGEDALKLVGEEEVDLVLLDLNLGSKSGLDVLKTLREVDPEVLVIIITGYGTVESAVEALKMGAYDYIKKPFKADAIRLIVRLALETQNLRREVRQLKREGQEKGLPGADMVGSSEELLQVYRQVREVAKHETATVLIGGESGTGKELVARAIHNLSPRRERPFIEINCGSLPFNLLETELFGHERGAFTDAKTRKIGLFEEANGGTIFLDEIGEMDMNLQVKLLRVLEDRKIRRLGGARNIDIDVRVVAATNRNLKQAIEEKTFREDLYYRLNVFPIFVPPLRERREDIPPLLDYFLKRFSREFNKTHPRGLPRGPRPAAALPLAGECARTAQRRRAHLHHDQRRGDPPGTPPRRDLRQRPAEGFALLLRDSPRGDPPRRDDRRDRKRADRQGAEDHRRQYRQDRTAAQRAPRHPALQGREV